MGKENRNPAKKPSQETNELLARLVELATETNQLLGQILEPYTNDDIGPDDGTDQADGSQAPKTGQTPAKSKPAKSGAVDPQKPA